MDRLIYNFNRPLQNYVLTDRKDTNHDYNMVENILVWSLISGTLLSYVPQYYKIYQNKSPKGLSESTVVFGLYSCIFNVLGTIQQDYTELRNCSKHNNCYSSIIPIIQLIAPLLCILILYIYYIWYANNLFDNNAFKSDNYTKDYSKIQDIYIRCKYNILAIILLFTIFIIINSIEKTNIIINSGKILNIISAILSMIMWFPQIYMTYHLKNAHSLSLIALTIHSIGCFATVIYQGILLHQNWLVVVNYIIGGISEAIIVCLGLYYKRVNKIILHNLDIGLIQQL